MTFEQVMRLMRDMHRTFSTSAPPVIVHSRHELVRERLSHRVRRRSLARAIKQATGESMFAIHRRKLRRAELARADPPR